MPDRWLIRLYPVWKERVNSGKKRGPAIIEQADVEDRKDPLVAACVQMIVSLHKTIAMNDTTTATLGAPAARPTLLTVICILSFIAGLWGIYSGISTLTTDQTAAVAVAQQKMEEARAQLGDKADGMAGRMMDSAMAITQKGAENAKPIGISGIILSLLSLFGVWQMWNLKKSGFWLYLVAAIGGLIVPLVFLGGGMMAIASVGFVGFITLIFIILYAVNLKYMH